MLSRVWLAVGVWAFAAVACVAFVADTMLGPTIFVVEQGAHGVHLGDVLACIGFPGWAYLVTRSFWLPERRDAGATRRGCP